MVRCTVATITLSLSTTLIGCRAGLHQPAPSAAAATAAAVRASPFAGGPVDSLAARRLAGCYALHVGPWSAPKAHGGQMPIPALVALDTTRHTTRTIPEHQLVARTPGFAVPHAMRGGTPGWVPVGADSVQVVAWADGTSTLNLFLRRTTPDGDLTGTARYFTDGVVLDKTGRWMWETYPTAPATMRRVGAAGDGGACVDDE